MGSKLLNAPQRQLEVYADPGFAGYGATAVLREGTAAPARFPDAGIEVEKLFR